MRAFSRTSITMETGKVDPGPLIRLDQVAMTFGDLPVLAGIALDVQRGETLAVIGESGCGKTVLLKLIIGLLTPSSGRVIFDGRVMAELSDRELTRERLRFGFLFQGAALFDSLTIFENVAFGLREGGFRRRHPGGQRRDESSLRDIVLQRLQEVGLPEDVEHKKPAELSGGMKKRVGLARALALEPEVMLYDEPTTGLDPIMSDVINELILQTRRRHPVTSIVVTHDLSTVHKVADRVLMLYPLGRLERGEKQVLFDGPPQALARCPDPRVRQFVEGRSLEQFSEKNRNGE